MDIIIVSEFIDHFRELNSILSHTDVSPFPFDTLPTTDNYVINQPFSVDEIKVGIKLLNNNKSGGADNMITEFYKHCHINSIVDLKKNIVLYTSILVSYYVNTVLILSSQK